MPAYGAYLPEKTNVFESSLIIAFSDFFVSVLSSVVLFTTLYGCGMENEISQSGIVTAFMVYPAAITLAFGNNVILNSVVGILFYLSLALMALQSSVSMIEAAANPLSEKTGVNKKRLAVFISVAGAGVCLVFATGIAPAVLDVADHFLNYFNILILGTLECLLLGLNAKRVSLADEINRFTKKAKMPEKLLVFSLKYLSPAVLFFMTVWGYAHLITDEGGLYGGYSIWLNIFGWILGAAVLASGFIICGVDRIRKNRRKTKVTALALTK